MRVSTGMIFDAGISSINRQTASLLHVQQQVASGRRILTPSDDPVAAAQALMVTQSSDAIVQFKRNQGNATSVLGLQEAQLSGVTDVLGRIQELAVQASDTSLSATSRKGIATELRSRFDQLLGTANADDGTGQKMFAGYMGTTTPFSGSVDNILATGNDVTYLGDNGQRTLQVSPNRFIEASDSGSDVFMNIRSGNGYFTTNYAVGNSGTGVVASSSVTDPAAWNAAATTNVAIRFTVAAGVTTYDLIDTVSGNSLLTGGPGPAAVANQRTYQSGQTIVMKSQGAEAAFNLGASVTITGAPASGDSFSVKPSTSQSVFATLAHLIGALETPPGTPADTAKYSSDIASAVANLGQASNNIMRVRAGIGSRMNELDSLGSLNDTLNLQTTQTLSNLQDIDYATAVTNLTRNQTNLQAAQQSFAKISQLSLFNYL